MELTKHLKYWYIKIPAYILFLYIILYYEWTILQSMTIISIYVLINSLVRKTFNTKSYLKSLGIIFLMILLMKMISSWFSPALTIILSHIIGVSIILYVNKEIIKESWNAVKKSLDPIKQKNKEKREWEKEKKSVIKESVVGVENTKIKAK